MENIYPQDPRFEGQSVHFPSDYLPYRIIFETIILSGFELN